MEPEDDKDLLGEALSGTPPPAEETPAAVEPSGDRPRDDLGRFAPKEEAAPVVEPQAGQPVATPPQDNRVPLQVLLDEREKRQNHERELADYKARVEHLSRLVGQQQQPQQPDAPPVDIFADPDAFFNQRVDPLRQQAAEAISAVDRKLEQLSKRMAIRTHGEETVRSAYEALYGSLQTGQGQYDYQKIMSSEDPYDALVEWHQTQTNLAKVGRDPGAWLEAEIAKRMQDPAFVAKVLDQQRASLSNGSGSPAKVQLPPSLSRTPASMGTVDDGGVDEDDAALLKHALRQR